MPLISTPCVRICVIDDGERICLGCGRTEAEIASWSRIDEDTRRAIMVELGARLERLATRLNQEDPCRD